MNILKSLGLSLLTFLLFLSISIFGLAFMLNSTILKADFITSEVDRLNVSSLVEETINENHQGAEFPQESETAFIDAITKLEPLVKEQLSAATYSVYDYLLARKQNPELALILRNTFLNHDFVTSVTNELDISSFAAGFLREELTEEGEIPEDVEYLIDYLDVALIELEPWIEEQLITAADPVFDYLLGENQNLSVVIPLETIPEGIEEPLRKAYVESPPPKYAGLSQYELEQRFDEDFAEFTEAMPATFELDETLISPETPAEIAEVITEAEEILEDAKQYVSIFRLGYILLIVFMVLLTTGIILINREVRSTTRGLGTAFLTYGAFEYAGIFVAKYFIDRELLLPDMPLALQTWTPQFLDNILAPLAMLSLGLIIGGVILIIVSFVYRPRQAELPNDDYSASPESPAE